MSIIVKNLSHTYSKGTPFEKAAIEDINLTVEKGEFLGIIGHTGSGKSTLAECVCGLQKPKQGSVQIDDIELTKNYDKKELRSKIGMVFQYPEQQLFEETVLKDVCFGPKNMGQTEEEQLKNARWAMQLMGLDESFEKRSPVNLSGGEKRRAAMAGVLAMRPQYLILDEPTVGLDPQGYRQMLAVIKNLHVHENMTVIMISHSMDLVAQMADKIAVLHEGRIIKCDAPFEIFKEHEYLKSIGLDVPEMIKIGVLLEQRGLHVKPALTAHDMAKNIALALREGADV